MTRRKTRSLMEQTLDAHTPKEILGANNGNWTIVSIQHDLRGSLDITAPAVFQTEVIIYVRKLT